MLFNISLTINSNSVYIAETYKQIMQKNCINYGIVVKNDTSDGRIANAIANVSIKDSYKTIIMATFFDETNNSDFRMFAFKNLSEEEKTKHGIKSHKDLNNEMLAKINANSLKSIIRRYYNTEVRDIDNYDSKEANSILDGFTSHSARFAAKVYTATKILNIYHKTNSTNKIIETLIQEIGSEYLNNYMNPLVKEILSKTNPIFKNNQIELATQINEISKQIKESIEDRKKLDSYLKSVKTATDEETVNARKEAKTKFDNLAVNETKLRNDRRNLLYNLSKILPSAYTKHRNFSALYEQLLNEDKRKQWYDEVFRLKRLVNGRKLFKVLTEEEKQFESIIEDEDSWMNFDNDDSIDLTAKTWADNVYKSYEQNVAADVKLLLSDLYDVQVPVEKNQDEGRISYYIQPELGVRVALSPEFVIQQLSNCDFTSKENFLESVWELSQNVRELYGLGVLYNKMQANPVLLNRIFTELALNKTKKVQAYVNNSGIVVQLSNPEADAISNLLYKMVTSTINGYRTFYDQNDLQKITYYINNAQVVFNNPSLKEKLISFIEDYCNKYFPTIETSVIRNYLYRSNITTNEVITFLNAIKEFQSGVSSIHVAYRKAWDKYNRELKEYKDEIRREQDDFSLSALLFGETEQKSKKERIKPSLDLSEVNYDSLYSKILPIARELSRVTLIDTKLNSYNAENNMGSDLLQNSRIMNILKQIAHTSKDANGNIVRSGLERIKEFITDSTGKVLHQYRYSNLFFGSGTTKGMFTLLPNGKIEINPEATTIIKAELFDGIKNRVEDEGTTYQGMSKGDYFMTMLEAFHQTINYYDKTHENQGGYFMRTPSDAPKNFVIQTTKFKLNSLITTAGINRNSDFYKAIKNIVYSELNDFIYAIQLLSEDGKITNEKKDKYFEHYHYNKRNGVIKNGKLTGNVFNFSKLPEVGGININEELQKAFLLYGVDNTNLLQFDGENLIVNADVLNSFIKEDYTKYNAAVEEIIDKWIVAFNARTERKASKYATIIDGKFTDGEIKEAMLNYVVAYNNFDALFEGDAKFYADPRTFLKRAKEAQAGGKAYSGFSFGDSITGDIKDLGVIFDKDSDHIELKAIRARNGFNAITINNVIRASEYADNLENKLYNSLIKMNYSEAEAKAKAKEISDKYRGKTKTDDAQSYITIEEFIRRKYADGTINKYKDLLNAIYNLVPDENGNYDTSSIDLTKIDARIQVQKNFYYDINRDEETGLNHPRQIKNAEFVLIPQLLPADSKLRELYEMMKRNGIDQVNTSETSKAAKKNIVTYFNPDGSINKKFDEEIKDKPVISKYYYQSLYKQQDVPSHLKDMRNKAGIQIMKKVVDNYHTASEKVKKAVDTYFEAYSANIKDSFFRFIDSMGWKYDAVNNKIVNKDGREELNFDKYYELAKTEAQRLGLDSNFIDYLVPTENGQPVMPNFMNNVSTKLESIAQSMFNNHITRQTLPGWHCAQVANAGFSKKLKYHPEEKDENGNVIRHARVECLLPRWSNLIPKGYPIEKLKEEGLTIQIAYRIPTEGKQSIVVLEVVGWLDDIYDSTIVLPDEWVEQTGSDMDGDSVYGVTYPMIMIIDENGEERLVKIKYDLDPSEKATRKRYNDYVKRELRTRHKKDDLNLIKSVPKNEYSALINTIQTVASENDLLTYTEFSKKSVMEQLSPEQRETIILDQMITIMEDYSSLEENLTGSTFVDLKNAMEKLNSVRKEANKATEDVESSYDPFTQLDYMENAMSGARLKAFSVNRDTFNSIANKGQARLGKGFKINVLYPVEGSAGAYQRKLYDKYAWSDNNRNDAGKILTAYSSQTTAHILDAIKEGTVYNENEYTFGVFKTLVDLGMTYEVAMTFLMQPGVAIINDAYFEVNSLYINSYGNPIQNAYRNIAERLGITIKGKAIDKYTSINEIKEAIKNNEELVEVIKEIANVNEIKDIFDFNYPINYKAISDRLHQPTYSTELRDIATDFVVINNFAKLKKLSDNIEEILNVCKPDKFGAKQTIRETREVIIKLSKFTDVKNPIARTLVIPKMYEIEENGKIEEKIVEIPFITELYGNNSFYPYLSAFINFSTRQSQRINKELFALEQEQYVINENLLEDAIGRRLTDDEYKRYKQYIVSSAYNQIDVLEKPLTINKKGYIVLDERRLDEYTALDNGYNPILKERFRVCGYNTQEIVDIDIEDFDNPTEDEIYKFNQLSAGQKVLWIQKHFKDNAGLFNLLNVRTYNHNELKNKGYMTTLITYEDTGKDIDELIHQFDAKFNSKHPFVKLTMIDLVKYAFYVEGFNFKSGNISRIVSNRSLLNYSYFGDSNIIDSIKELINGGNYLDLDQISRRFIRSHSTIVPNIELKNNTDLWAGFLQSNVYGDLYKISIQEGKSAQVSQFLDYLTKGREDIPKYIRITTGPKENRTTTLFAVISPDLSNDLSGIYLYPLNELDAHETYDVSANVNNNKFFNESYYEALINLNEGLDVELKHYARKNSKYDQANPAIRERLEELNSENKITKYEFDNAISLLEDSNRLIKLSQDKNDKILANEAKAFLENIDKAVRTTQSNYTIIEYPGYNISKLFKLGDENITVPFVQTINGVDGNYKIKISKHQLSKAAYRFLMDPTSTKVPNIDIEELSAVRNALKHPNTSFYKIELINDRQKLEDIQKAKEENKEFLSSTTDIRSDVDMEIEANQFSTLTKVTKKIIDTIQNNKRRAVVDERDMFINRLEDAHVDIYSLINIEDNNEIIFRSIAEYYRTLTTKLLRDINAFVASNGEIYDIGQPELYEYLSKYDEDYNKIVDILLRARNISQSLKPLFEINLDSENPNVTNYIKSIKQSIDSITNNTKVKQGFNNIFNIYFAKKYSNNPNVKDGLVLLTEQFGDATKADLLLADVTELDNKQVQAVAKMVNNIVAEAEQITAPKAAREFEKQYEAIMEQPGDLDFNKIIDEQGKFVLPYTKEFIEQRDKHIDEIINIRETYGTRSVQYIDAKLKWDKWKLANMEQPLVEEYYRERIAIEEELYNVAKDLYVDYLNLIAKLSETKYENNKTLEQIRQENLIRLQISDLFSAFLPDGQLKPQHEINKITALKNFFAKKRILNDKHFNNKVNQEFLNLVDFYENIIKEYDRQNPNKNIDEKLQDEKYSNAYYWLASNGTYDIVGEAKSDIIDAFTALRDENTHRNETLKSMMKSKSRVDAFGTIDGREFTSDEIEELRKDIELSYNAEPFTESDATLIKIVPEDENVYTKEYYKLFTSKLTNEEKIEKRNIQYDINQILIKGFDVNGKFSSKTLFENCTNEELETLGNLYKKLRALSHKMTKDERNALEQEVNFESNDEAFNEEYLYYRTNLMNDRNKANLWKNIFLEWNFNEFGYYEITLVDNKVVGNRSLFSYTVPKDRYIDQSKTAARKLINKNVQFVPTEYYYIASKQASNEGRFEEWFKQNHVYNPYKRTWVPLPIWTHMTLTPNTDYTDSYQFIPNKENIDNNAKPSSINANYKKVPGNYKGNNYSNLVDLNSKELDMLNLLQSTIKAYNIGGKAEAFANEGFAPRQYKPIEDKSFYINQGLGVLGLNYKSHRNDKYYDNFDYEHDEEIDFPMMDLLKVKGYKKTKKYLPKLKNETTEQWKERNKDIIDYNEKVKAENLRLDNLYLDRDWKNVFYNFVMNASVYEAKDRLKDTLYLLLESLRDNPAFKVDNFGKVKTTKHSTKELLDYDMTTQKNYYSVVENWARRVIHSQFKEKSYFTGFADLMQNITSAKYMILNVTGGVANITTGLTNIMGENFAKDYFGSKEFANAQSRYLSNVHNFLGDMYKETSDVYEVALTKFFDVVDYDAMLERKTGETVGEKIERARNLLYGLQAGGEHYMQNSVLFAMLQSTRIYEEDGRTKIGSFAEYTNMIEKKALMKVIGDDQILFNAYKYYLNEIKNDANKRKDIDRFNRNAYIEFAREHFTKEQIQDFIDTRKEYLKDAEVEFNKLDTIESQLEFKDGKVSRKSDSVLTDADIISLRGKVISVNKLIHGVYDKYGAARLERKWYGSLVMQYHKHLYPGIMKRWRGVLGSGYYNESRGGVQYGSYVSLARFMATEFRNLKFKDENGDTIRALESIQSVIKASYNTIANIGINWAIMPEWEKRNCRRAIGDLCGVAAALLTAILLHALTDDDELKDSNTLATILYLTDRLNSEASMYTLWGLVTETKTMYSSPLAMLNGPEDLLKSLEIATRWLFDEDYNINYTTGQYAGQNKLYVRLKRNIPIYRVYDRLSHMANNNQYYRIGDNNWNIKLSRNIADIINPEE